MVERAYDAHLKQYVYVPDPETGRKRPVKCKEHIATNPKVCGGSRGAMKCSAH
jgi:hypothetical protein